MSETLRYVGPTTDEFQQDVVYEVRITVDEGSYAIQAQSGATLHYPHLLAMLAAWQPPGFHDEQGRKHADHGKGS